MNGGCPEFRVTPVYGRGSMLEKQARLTGTPALPLAHRSRGLSDNYHCGASTRKWPRHRVCPKIEPQNGRLGYARVSTYGQTLDAQLEQLRKAGCAKIYRKKVTGARADWRELLTIRCVFGLEAAGR